MRTRIICLMLAIKLNLIAGEATFLVSDPTQPVTLTCPLPISGDVTWSHNGSNIGNSSKYSINNQNKTLTIASITCQPIMPKSPKTSLNLIEGAVMTLACDGYSFPAPTGGSWMKEGPTDPLQEYDPRVNTDFTTSGLQGTGRLTIDGIRTEDQGDYRCSMQNEIGRGNITFKVRINSKLAPLWPIIGIIVEILMVIIIITVLEKRKSKVDNKES